MPLTATCCSSTPSRAIGPTTAAISDSELDLVLPFDDAPIDVHLPIVSPVPQFERTEPRVSRSTPLDFDISVSASLDESELRQPV